jgi:general L-amino acid transport system permease protein
MANMDATSADVAFRPKPSQPPPPNTVGVVGWLRKNLFGGPVDTVVTIFCGYVGPAGPVSRTG